MKELTIQNERLINYFGTNKITPKILSNHNSFSFQIPLSKNNLPILEELNKVVEFFDDVKCSITFYSQNHTLNNFQETDGFEYYSTLNNNSRRIIFALQNTSPNFSQINIDSAFYSLDLPKDLMEKFSRLDTLRIKGLKNVSQFGTLFIPPNVKALKLYNINEILDLDTSKVNNLSDLVLFLDQYFLLEGSNTPKFGIENLDLSENEANQVFNLYNLQQRFPNLKNLKMHPDYKFLGPLSPDEISFLVQVAGQIKIEQTYDDLNGLIKNYIPFEIKGIKKIGNIFYDPKKIKLKPIKLSYEKYKNISDKSRFKNAFVKINIKNMSELSTEEAIKLKEQIPNCQISVEEVINDLSIYSLDDYILMSKWIDEILSTIDPNSSEQEQYSHIYEAMSVIFYNFDANYNLDPEFVKTHPYNNFIAYCLDNTSRNLYGALKYNSAVCAGIASAIHNACARQGLTSKIVAGCFFDFVSLSTLQNYDRTNHKYRIFENIGSFHFLIKDLKAEHAWIQVKFGENWYNSDLTWDLERLRNHYLPKYFLFTDDENLQRRCISDNDSNKCSSHFSSPKLAQIFPNLQPEPLTQTIRTTPEQILLLKKCSYNKYNSFSYYIGRPSRVYRESNKKYPLPPKPSIEEPKLPARENKIREQVQQNPYYFATSDTFDYPSTPTNPKISSKKSPEEFQDR